MILTLSSSPSLSKDFLHKLLASCGLVLALLASPSYAGEEWSEEHILREISYLAKKLLDRSDKDEIAFESPAFLRPMIGICSDIQEEGIKLTCVTPGTEAAKAGLQTGDLIVKMRGLDFAGVGKTQGSHNFKNIVKTMKTGEKLEIVLYRENKKMEFVVTVGSVSHPAYTLEIKR